ncbi:MAG: putative glycoside hydrolase [Elusimicrobiota bacterium]
MLLQALLSGCLALPVLAALPDPQAPSVALSSEAPAAPAAPDPAATVHRALRGVHMTGWGAGSRKARQALIRGVKDSGLDTVVIALKEYDGLMFVRDVKLSKEIGAYVNAIPDLPAVVKDFKAAGIYTIARIVMFKDNRLARQRPDLAVHRPDGSLWTNDKGVAWVDPYRKEVWEYNLEIAERAAAAGFDEIQFDYIRFPSDGPTRLCRYSRADHSPQTAAKALLEFLRLARQRLKPLGVDLSIAVFGMTTTDDSGMGIGQRISDMAREVDWISPMMYPSHYAKGEYGIKNPNREPYKTISLGTRDAAARLGADAWKMRPYFQDFSLGVRYREEQVRAQILAAKKNGVTSWLLWNAQNNYTWGAMRHNNRFIMDEPDAEGADGSQEKKP